MCSKAFMEVHSCLVLFSLPSVFYFFEFLSWSPQILTTPTCFPCFVHLFACLLDTLLCNSFFSFFRCLRSRLSWTHFLSGLYWLLASSPTFLLLLKTGEDTAWRRGCLSPDSRVKTLLLLFTHNGNSICWFVCLSSSTNATTHTSPSALLLRLKYLEAYVSVNSQNSTRFHVYIL